VIFIYLFLYSVIIGIHNHRKGDMLMTAMEYVQWFLSEDHVTSQRVAQMVAYRLSEYRAKVIAEDPKCN